MTALDPDNTSRNLDSSEQTGFAYDDPNYVPEREFVLMPLFRRLGEWLGLSRQTEAEYIYEPEPSAPGVESRVAESESAPEAPVVNLEAHGPTPANAMPAVEAEPPAVAGGQVDSEPKDFLEIEPAATPEPVMVQQWNVPEPEPWIADDSVLSEVNHEEMDAPVSQHFEAESADETVLETHRIQLVQRTASAEEIKNLVVPLREAAERISAAISQAAGWLHGKEEEILKRAELPLGPATPNTGAESLPVVHREAAEEPASNVPLEAHTLIASTPVAVPIAEVSSAAYPRQSLDAPALQRELAWQHQPAPRQLEQPAVPAYRQPVVEFTGRKPQVVPSPAKVPFWNRIDWGQQFTPKRIAIIGGVAMAALMILGISIARRPASSALPQQQTRAFEPGGVTLSAHPVTPAVATPVQPLRSSAPTPRRAASRAPVREHRAARYDREPDVVTHYYGNRQKPSPVRQSTVAGVRHYSDMQ